MICRIQREVRSFGGSVDDDIVELTAEVARRGQNPRNSFDGIQIGMFKRIVAGDRRITRALCLPGAKVAGGSNISARNGIDEYGLVLPGDIGPDIV